MLTIRNVSNRCVIAWDGIDILERICLNAEEARLSVPLFKFKYHKAGSEKAKKFHGNKELVEVEFIGPTGKASFSTIIRRDDKPWRDGTTIKVSLTQTEPIGGPVENCPKCNAPVKPTTIRCVYCATFMPGVTEADKERVRAQDNMTAMRETLTGICLTNGYAKTLRAMAEAFEDVACEHLASAETKEKGRAYRRVANSMIHLASTLPTNS